MSLQLLDRDSCLSIQRNRAFAERIDYDTPDALHAALKDAQEDLPPVESAYKCSGKTTLLSMATLLLITPLLIAALTIFCGGICFGFMLLEANVHTGGVTTPSRFFGILSIVLDLVLVMTLIVVPAKTFKLLSRATKNRNAMLPSILTGLSILVISILLFMPIWHGATLAPTDLSFLYIPIRWVLILIGVLIIPLVAAITVYMAVAEQKYCEESGEFLEPNWNLAIDFDYAENALELLKKREYTALVQLPQPSNQHPKRKAQIVLWSQERATRAFMEMTVFFYGKTTEKDGIKKTEKEKEHEWLVFSSIISLAEARTFAIPEKSKCPANPMGSLA